MDEQPILNAVLARPDDDEPRLAYADWLDRRADPRAECIRVQIRLARGTPADRVALKLRERQLLAAFQSEWAAPLAGLVTGVRFRRGFPEWVSVDARRFLDAGGELFRLAPVRRVWLRRAAGLTRELAGCPLLARLGAVDLDTNWLDEAEVVEFLGSPHLGRVRGLGLSENRVGVAALRALAASRRGWGRSASSRP